MATQSINLALVLYLISAVKHLAHSKVKLLTSLAFLLLKYIKNSTLANINAREKD
jgi:hypothetical protein